ncbi:MAG: hypothetical protein ACOYJC_11290 [Christensenellales bacterium]|jgi:hypothetical protein
MQRFLKPQYLIAILYPAFILLDVLGLGGELSNALKLTGVACCLWIAAAQTKGRGTNCIAAAFFTLTADIFLLFTRCHTLGVAVFCAAQAFRSLQFGMRKKLLGAVAVMGAAASGAVYALGLPLLYAVSTLYAVLLLANMVYAFVKRGRGFRLARWGMVLFVLCDMHVAAANLPWLPVYNAAFLLSWVFYMPSQLLLALSGAYMFQEGEDAVG